MRYSSRFWLYAPVTAVLILAAAVAIHWWFAAQTFETALAAAKGHEAAPGITLNWTKVAVGGFPFRLDADFENFSVAGAGAHGPFAWTSEGFALHTLTYGRRKTVYEAAGRQHLQWAASDGQIHRADFLPGTLRASSTADARGLARFDLDVVDAVGDGFTARRLQFHMRRDPDGKSLDVMARAEDFTGAGEKAPLVEGYFTLTDAAALMPLLDGKAAWPDTVRAWHDGGGRQKLTKGTRADLAAQALSGLF
jgi:hypothetical protein